MPQTQYQTPAVAVNTPTINGRDITVDFLLKNPTVIASRVANFALQRLISGYIFRTVGNVQGGAVIYNRIDSNQVYLSRGPRTVAEGAEFPLVEAQEPAPLIITTSKLGGQWQITDEARRRNSQDAMEQVQTKMVNNFVRNQDLLCMAALANDPVISAAVGADGRQGGTQAAVAQWSDNTNGNPIKDIATAVANINNRELEYTVDTVLVNPVDATNLLIRPDIRMALPRESSDNPILSGALNGFMDLSWIQSNRVPQGTAYFLQRQIIGAVAEEVPYRVETERLMNRQVTAMYASRTTGVFIDNPYAVIKLTGI